MKCRTPEAAEGPPGVLLVFKTPISAKKYKNMRFCYVKSLYFRYISKIKKFRTKIPDLGTFFVRNSSFLDYLHQTNFPVSS